MEWEAMKWEDVSFGLPLDKVNKVASTIERGGRAYRQGLNAVEGFLRIRDSLSKISESSTLENITNIISRIEGELDFPLSARTEANAYLLDIPLIRPNKDNPDLPDIRSGSLTDILMHAGLRYPAENAQGVGGNYGVYKKIVESIFDEDDYSRPHFGGDCEMGAVLVVYGARNVIPALGIASALSTMFDGALNLPPELHYKGKIPQNPKIRAVSTESCSRNVDNEIDLDDYDGFRSASFVYYWDYPEVESRLSPGGLVRRITKGRILVKKEEKIQAGEGSESFVVHEFEVDGVPPYDHVYITGMDPEETYYISSCFVYEVLEEETGDVIETPVNLRSLSEQLRVVPEEMTDSAKGVSGTPPDWRRIKNTSFVVPGMEKQVNRLRRLEKNVRSSLVSFEQNYLSDNVSSGSDRVDRVIGIASQIRSTLDNISTQIQNLNSYRGSDGDAGIWSTYFHGKATKPSFIRKTGKVLLSSTSKNKPPFTQGDEPVGALMFLVVGKSVTDVETMIRPIRSLVGIIRSDDDEGDMSHVIEDLDDTSDIEEEVEGSPSEQESSTLHDLGVDDDPC